MYKAKIALCSDNYTKHKNEIFSIRNYLTLSLVVLEVSWDSE